MKYLLVIMLIVINIQAGENIRVVETYNQCNKKDQSVFILDCIKNANPKSDEEPEDWIYMCKNMSLDLFCTVSRTPVYYTWGSVFSDDISCKCSECKDENAIKYCEDRGWSTK